MSKEKKKKPHPNKGSNSKLTPENRVKLQEAAALDCTVEEMAFFCDVSRQTVYNWFKEDPELFDKVERLRQTPILKARKTVVDKLDESYGNSMDYLKRKRRTEFGDSVDVTTQGDKMGEVNIPKEDRALIEKLHEGLKANMKRRSREKAKKEGELVVKEKQDEESVQS